MAGHTHAGGTPGIDTMQKLCEVVPKARKKRDITGRTLLVAVVVAKGGAPAVAALLAVGADVGTRDWHGAKAMHVVANARCAETLELLLPVGGALIAG